VTPPALKEFLKAFAESDKTYDEIMSFLKPSNLPCRIMQMKSKNLWAEGGGFPAD